MSGRRQVWSGRPDPRSRSPRRAPRAAAAGLLLLAGPILLAACRAPRPAAAVGTLERERLELIAEVSEPILAIHVVEGDRVETGDLLVELDSRRPAARLAAAESARARAAARLAELTRGTRKEEIREARARLAEAEAALDDAALELERARALAAAAVDSRSRLDRADAAQREAAARRDALRAVLERLIAGATVEELDQAQAQVAEAEAQAEALRLDLERTRIVASRPGVIDALPYEIGEQPPPGGTVAVLLAAGAPYARVYVPAPLRAVVRPGGGASVRLEGVAEPYAGRVRSVAAEAAFTPFFALTEQDRSRLSYLAEVDLTGERASELPTGLPVEVVFEP